MSLLTFIKLNMSWLEREKRVRALLTEDIKEQETRGWCSRDTREEDIYISADLCSTWSCQLRIQIFSEQSKSRQCRLKSANQHRSSRPPPSLAVISKTSRWKITRANTWSYFSIRLTLHSCVRQVTPHRTWWIRDRPRWSFSFRNHFLQRSHGRISSN